ncbi:hypothetical protein CWI37_0628p0010 [Hamiltosporidium tvaerminnensis]|uniref:Uncharacterized protein n=2 Tax=Hamiltosporidium TaxID=1176354 RepID=A0A4Q9LFN3_9MICR|nr:hypothetical protein CWI37_0628p0010 [Hamiltosporidium tvaerminnensis]TBU06848.1 hypothetical protein CWI39_0414p0020 [Hamiltosporidium magnivora]
MIKRNIFIKTITLISLLSSSFLTTYSTFIINKYLTPLYIKILVFPYILLFIILTFYIFKQTNTKHNGKTVISVFSLNFLGLIGCMIGPLFWIGKDKHKIVSKIVKGVSICSGNKGVLCITSVIKGVLCISSVIKGVLCITSLIKGVLIKIFCNRYFKGVLFKIS